MREEEENAFLRCCASGGTGSDGGASVTADLRSRLKAFWKQFHWGEHHYHPTGAARMVPDRVCGQKTEQLYQFSCCFCGKMTWNRELPRAGRGGGW
jgi:hypothetical protein